MRVSVFRYEVSGVERLKVTWDQQRMELVKERHARVDGQGLFVQSGSGVFRIPECSAWIFCNDDVKKLIEDHCCTNVSFLEMGDVLDTPP